MAVTLKDVAKRAGVSPTTVSLVLNQGSNSRISETTRQKILEAIKELGYQPTKPTQSIPQSIPPTLGLVITDITNPFFTAMASVIEDVASRYGYNIILCNTRRNLKKEMEFLEVLWRRKVDGLIIAPVDDKKSSLQDFLKHNIPVVFVDRSLKETEASAVLLDNVEGAFTAVDYLIRLGHRRIGLINGRRNTMTGQERLQGYLKALKEHGLAIGEGLISEGRYSVEGGRQATEELLNLPHPPTAIFSSGGVMTVGALLEIKERNVKIPEDLSIISFDDEKWCLLIDPPLTVVAQPVHEIATEAAQLVIQLIQGWGADAAQKIILKPELIIRGSCKEYSG
jgi:LacI family transcriptional regulator